MKLLPFIARALHTHRSRIIITLRIFPAVILTCLSMPVTAETKTAKEVLTESFWGELYKDGGTTYYCEKEFKRKSALISASYIYPQGSIRQFLGCGTKRQCMRDSDDYNTIASDLHNIVPAKAFFEVKRTATVFGILDESIDADDCGLRRKLHVIEPPEHLKGDIARVIMYMNERYGLPIIGNRSDLESWSLIDPPSDEEILRNQRVTELQGYGNTLVEDNSVASNQLSGIASNF